jgi:glycosyltransferase involved in cell wall biosynthesis
MQHPEISLVIPVYNEEGNLPVLFGEIEAAMTGVAAAWEVLFVDDGSTDSSLAVIRSLADNAPQIRYVAFEKNCGQSAAFAAGFREAKGEVLVTLDADLQNDPADIPAMLALYGKDGISMVVGWRAERKDTFAKHLASKAGNAIRNRITRDTIKDTGCSLKVMRADMARNLPVFNGMHRFFTCLMRLDGAVIAEMKVNHRPRLAGVSKYGIWDRARKTAFDLLAVRWLQNRHISYAIRERKG